MVLQNYQRIGDLRGQLAQLMKDFFFFFVNILEVEHNQKSNNLILVHPEMKGVKKNSSVNQAQQRH